MSETDISVWIAGAKRGDPTAVERLWSCYFERLAAAVRRRLRGQNTAARDEEDIVLSVFDSFCDAARQGRFPDLTHRDDLWQLLFRMAVRKVIDKRRHDQRERRGGRVKTSSLYSQEYGSELPELVDGEPSPEAVAELQETVERFFSHLGVGPLRDLAGARLEGYSNVELARQFNCSERTIERRLHLIREKCRQEIFPDDQPPSPADPNRDP